MATSSRMAEVAAVIGEPSRAAMLAMLMDGRALTATELAGAAGITPQTASTHLSRLIDAGLVTVARQGRSRYHRLADPAVAGLLRGLEQHTTRQQVPCTAPRTGPGDEAMRRARTCYDHLAGRLGVAIADVVVAQGHVEMDDEAGLITEQGAAFLARVGIALPEASRRLTRPLCRPCLDWSERRPHLAGRLGAAICTHGFDAGWLRRVDGTRAVSVTPKGQAAMAEFFGIARL